MQEASVATTQAPPAALKTSEIVAVDPTRARALWTRATELSPDLPLEQDPETTAEALAGRGAALAPSLGRPLRDRLRRFAATGGPHQTLLVRGLLPDLAGPALGPTPDTVVPPVEDPAAAAAALSLLAAMSTIGEPVTFSSLHEGRLVQNVLPVPGQERTQTSGGSKTPLTWHVEDAFCEDRCDYVGLLCLRGAPDAVTMTSTITGLMLPPMAQLVLRQPRFTVIPDIAHGEQDPTGWARPADRPVPALSGPIGDMRLRVDTVYLAPADPRDRAARTALHFMHSALDAAAVAHNLEPGDLLVLDNRRAAHARTPFVPRYDGRDRWLLRVMVSHPDRHRRRGGPRLL